MKAISLILKMPMGAGAWSFRLGGGFLFCLFAIGAAWAGEGAWRKAGPEERVTLENDAARVVIWPEAGGAITEYLNKGTGTNYVAGEVEPGRGEFGWTDVSRQNEADPREQWFSSLPYEVRTVETDAALGVDLRCRAKGVESTRRILLDRSGSGLRVIVGARNLSDAPRRLYPRWHPYMILADPYAEHSAVYLPDAGGNVRKINVGETGWDGNFLDPGGFVIAANTKTGEGLWMTYESEKVPYLLTWTDYRFSKRHPLRGAFTVEPIMPPALRAPGESVEIAYDYFPFTADTPGDAFPMKGMGDSEAVPQAECFLRLVRPHFELIAGHTMIPKPNTARDAITQNRFFYSHRRRDRMALREWGIADALFSMPGRQDIPARIRFFARAFPEKSDPVKLQFQFFVRDDKERTVLEARRSVVLDAKTPESDQRVDVDLTELPDGEYTVGVEVLEEGHSEPIHRVVETRRLVGQHRKELAATRKDELVERPFVTALRKVDFQGQSLASLNIPIGLEDASGVARTNWPMTVGVPFGKGVLKSARSLSLRNASGGEVGYDSRVASTWEDGSIRWLLLDFAADIPANGHVFYSLRPGPAAGGDDHALLKERKDGILFDNGLVRWEWDFTGKSLGPLHAEDLWWKDGEGRSYEFRLEGEGAGLRIVRNGSYQAVVRATGWYYAKDANGEEEPVARGALRFTGYSGQPFLKIEHNVMFAGDAWHQRLGAYGLTLPVPAGKSVMADVDGKTRTLTIPFVLSQPRTNVLRISGSEGEQNPPGHRASGVFLFEGKDTQRTVVFRDFWRMNPKEVRMDSPAAVRFFYWPEDAAPMSYLPREDGWLPSSASPEAVGVGSSRTHTFFLADAPLEGTLQAVDRLFDEPPIAIVPPRYLVETQAMMPLQAYDPDRWPEIEKEISRVFDSYLLNRELWGWYGEWTYGALPNLFLTEEYRWADFGRYAHILNEQDIVQAPWLAYMRSGDRKYLKFAEANTRHLMEVGTINWSALWPESVGLSRRHHETIWLGQGDYGHTMLDPYLEMYHVLGDEPAWEAALAAAEAMKRQKTGAWRYISNPLAGLSRMFVETQDPSYKKEADRIWKDLCAPDRNDWWLYSHGDRAAMSYSQLNPECKKIWESWSREYPDRFAGMDARSALFLETQDPRFAADVLAAFRKPVSVEDKENPDPLRWGISSLTQHILDRVRALCCAGSTIKAARDFSETHPGEESRSSGAGGAD